MAPFLFLFFCFIPQVVAPKRGLADALYFTSIKSYFTNCEAPGLFL